MIRSSLILAGLLLTGTLYTECDPDAVSLDDIIKKNTEAMGGREAVEAIRSIQVDLHIKDPTFEVDGMILLKRMALVIDDGTIGKVFYPVFPPDRNAAEVVAWLRTGG